MVDDQPLIVLHREVVLSSVVNIVEALQRIFPTNEELLIMKLFICSHSSITIISILLSIKKKPLKNQKIAIRILSLFGGPTVIEKVCPFKVFLKCFFCCVHYQTFYCNSNTGN